MKPQNYMPNTENECIIDRMAILVKDMLALSLHLIIFHLPNMLNLFTTVYR